MAPGVRELGAKEGLSGSHLATKRKNDRMRIRLLIPLLTLAGCLPALADVFTLSSSLGVWSSATPSAGVTGVGTKQIRWGTPAGGSGQSGYDYNGSTPPPQNFATETQFLVGTFIHHNQPITGN